MEPKFAEFPATTVIGLGANVFTIKSPRWNGPKVIGPLWEEFFRRNREFGGRQSGIFFGACVAGDRPNGAGPEEIHYVAGAGVEPGTEIPVGMELVEIPAGRHAVFTHKGLLHTFGHTMNYIYGAWLPKSGIKLRDAPHFEIYDARYKHGSVDSEFDVYLPVE